MVQVKLYEKKILEQFDVHTLLRLPTGIFYAGGVKTNVLFFDKKPARTDGKAWTEKLWIYDLRTNQHFTQKERQMTRSVLDDFVKCYNVKNNQNRKETEQFHAYSYDDLIKRDKTSLDIFWLKDESLEDTENLLSWHQGKGRSSGSCFKTKKMVGCIYYFCAKIF